MDSNASARPPQAFGDYELIEEIGRGGMGVIWKARQVSLDRWVALKMIRDSQLASPKARERFRIEAEAAGRLHHPNIVPIYDFGAIDGVPFISMQLVEGTDLVRWAQSVPVEAAKLAPLMVKLAGAIHFAHQRGILHLDLKPANVLLDASGEPHITDFGLARRIDAAGAAVFTAEIVGSPNYMAPEQATGRVDELTIAADIYSLGTIMYELLCGRAPFRADSPLATLRKVQEEEPIPPRQLYRFADPDLETVCLKCMEKRPDRRYSSARALASDLERWLRGEPVHARPVTVAQRVSKWTRRHPVTAALIVLVHVLLVAGVGGIAWMGARASARATESHDRLVHTYVSGGNQLLDTGEDYTALLWLTEALRLENRGPVHEENHRYRIEAVLDHASQLQQAFFFKDRVRAANFDPESRRIIFGTSSGTARVFDLASGRPLTAEMTLPAAVHRVRFNRDATKVVTMDITGNARIWDASTGAPLTPILRGDDYLGDTGIGTPLPGAPITPVLRSGAEDQEPFEWAVLKLDPSAWFSRDGTTLLTAWGCRSAHLWDVATGRHLRDFSHHSLVVNAKFTSDNSYVVTGGSDKTVRLWDAQTGTPFGKPMVHDQVVSWTGFSRDGRRLLTVSDRRLIHVWDWHQGKELIPAFGHGDVLFAASFSPDGSKILSGGWDKTARIWDTATGLEIARFTLPGGIVSAAWSPDGRSFATACEDGVARIYDATGSARLLAALPHGSGEFYLSYSGNGARLVTFGFAGVARVWDLKQSDPSLLAIQHPHSAWAEFSADGTRIASSAGWPANNVRVFNATTGLPEGPAIPHGSAVRRARFSPDSRRLLTAGDDGLVRLLDPVSGRDLVPPLKHPAPVGEAILSPDLKTIASACADGFARLWDTATGRPVAQLRHAKKVGSVVFSPDGRLVATGSDDATARVWDAVTGTPVTAPLPHRGPITTVRFSPDGARLLTACQGPDDGKGAAQLWDLPSGRPAGVPFEHDDDVTDAEFSPDGSLVVTASQDHTARVWDVRTHRPLTPPMRHLDGLLEASFSRDGHRVATLASEGDVRLWDALTGEAITTSLPHRHSYDMGHLVFSPDGHRLLVVTGGDGLVVHEFKPATQPVATLVDRAEVLSGRRIDASAGMVPLDSETIAGHWRQLTAKPR